MEHGGCTSTQVFHECFGSQLTTLTGSSSVHLDIHISSGAISAAAASTAGALAAATDAIRKQAHTTCKDKANQLGLDAAWVNEAISAGAEQEGSNAISKCLKESDDKALQDITDLTGLSDRMHNLFSFISGVRTVIRRLVSHL